MPTDSKDSKVETTAHTPGPWQFYPNTTDRDGDSFVQTVAPYPLAVCVIVAECCESEAQMDANALLIAAAPDLFEAAKHAAMEWRLHGQLTDSCRVLEAAIAKAEGAK